MDETHRAALAELTAEHRALRAQLARLDEKIETLRLHLTEIPDSKKKALPPLESIPAFPSKPVAEPLPVVPPPLPSKLQVPKPATERDSLEVQFGTVWLVRAGIVILLTGLVFLGNYAYQNFIGLLGPAGKLALLGLAGALLGGAGAWLERGRESLRHFARVLMAGGFAAIYYAAYAAYFVPRLRIIESPSAAGTLLLALAGGMVGIAQRKQSQTLALGAVLLAYYTSAINPLGGFTLFSNLLLTSAAVFFLVRNRWTAIPFASLVATYASYGYWRFFHENGFSLRLAPHADFWTGTLYLTGYWSLFTAGALLPAPELSLAPTPGRASSGASFSGGARAAFVSFNNAAFFAFVASTLPQFRPHSFWIFSLVFGAVLLALAALANRIRRDDPLLDGTYLAQGLLLVSIGLAAKITGYQLALVLALESAALVTCARARHGWIFQIGAGLCASVACGLALEKIEHTPSLALPLGSVACLAFLYDARWLKHLTLTERRFNWRAAYFSILAMLLGFAITWHEVAAENRSVAFALITVAITLGTALHGLFELALAVQFYNCATIILWANADPRDAHWQTALLLGAAIALQQWWKKRKPAGDFFAPVYCAAGLALFLGWTCDHIPEPRQFSFYTAGVVALLGLAALRKSRTAVVLGAILAVIALHKIWTWSVPAALLSLDTLALLALLSAQRLAKQKIRAELYPIIAQRVVVAALLATLWMHVSRWAGAGEREFLLTISWTLLAAAVLGAGLALRERAYRLGGLVILAAAVARIFIVDVWRLETGYRIVTFLLLGAVLIAISFVYHKFSDKIRGWI